jgi:hypothetical protein
MRVVGKKRTMRERMVGMGGDTVESDKGWKKKVSRWRTMREVKEETRTLLEGEEWDWWRNPPATKNDGNVPKGL